DSKQQILEDQLQDRYELIFLYTLPIEEIMKTISTLNKNSVILLCGYTEDAKGYKIPADKFGELICDASSVPVYDMWNFRMGNGVLGGSLLSGETIGGYAAELAIRVLDGEQIDRIDNINEKVAEQIYDYEQLERFGIPLERLPHGSTVINKPFSFFDTYKELVIGTIIAFAVLMIYILLLINNIKNRKKAERQAYKANQELSALYEQLYAIDQQLKHELVERSIALEKLQVSEENYRMVAEATNDIIWDWNPENNLIHHSGGLNQMLGYSDAEFVNKEDFLEIIEKEDLEYVQTEFTKAFQNENHVSACEYRVRHKDGGTMWLHTKVKVLHNAHGYPVKIVGSHTDITELKEYQNKIWEMAYYDELTRLPNRVYLKDYINNQIHTGTDAPSAIIYIDIDDFKAINDNFGHNEGDRLLIEVGNILKEITGENDMVFRQGGDEFVVVFNHMSNRDEISKFVAKLNDKLSEPIRLCQGAFYITLSGGIVMVPTDGKDYDTLMKNADIALYFVKNNGKNSLMFFNLDMMEGAKEKMLLDHHLRSAVKGMNFSIQYQPIVNMETGKICKYEALIRWKNHELGQVPPSVFIKRAEENGLIIPIGNWIIRESCLFAAELNSKGYGNISVSINISPIQLRQKEFVPLVKSILEQTGAAPEKIEFEITESILIDSLEPSLKKLHQIKALGILISLDDFGQGYSSLTYLRILPINTLKIDKSFLDDFINADRNGQIICAIIELAHGMQLKVIAEGVETVEQYQFLKDNDCDMIQGYLISKPVSIQEAKKLLHSNAGMS
ncbi:MAG: EAL domain-containing protein, partial [Eubacteriales bacterium]|nr:EAL domain-containing protein [Eubacteriales bacterium]